MTDDRSARLEALLAERLGRSRPAPAGPAERGEGPVRAAPAQERMLFMEELDPDSTAYHMLFTLRIEGPLDIDALEGALGDIEERHEILRSVYRRQDGAETLVPGPPTFTLRRADLPDDAAALSRLQQQEFHRPFDLRNGPVWRGLLACTRADLHHLLLAVHHIAFDGHSADVLGRELAQGYAARLGHGQPPASPPVRYADHAAWARRRLEEGAHDGQQTYWARRLAQPPPPLELPTDHPRPRGAARPGAVVRRRLDAATADRVALLAREAAATPYMVLLAAFHALMHRYTGRPDILTGTPVTGRTTPQAEPLIGLFVNTVLLRTECGPQTTFRGLLDSVRREAAGAFAHQDLPFEKVAEALPYARGLDGPAPFEALFVWNRASAGAVALGDAKLTHVPYDGPTEAKCELTLEVTSQGGALELELEYRRDLWDAPTAARMLDHFTLLLDAAVTAPERLVETLPLLGEQEHTTAARHARGPQLDYPGPADLAAMVAGCAADHPDDVAVVCGEERLTYRELDARADRLARHLRNAGAAPEVPVGVLLERSADLVVAIVAVMRAGAPYLPLSPDHPAARTAEVLRDAGARLVVTQDAVAGQWSAAVADAGCTPVALDTDAARIAACETGVPLPLPLPLPPPPADRTAYVFYTSGSTGRPKGVMVGHRAAHNQIRWQIDRFGLGPGQAVLLKTDVTFDDSVVEVFGALASGARLVVAAPGGHRDPVYLRQLMATEQVTYVRFVPTMLAALLEHGGDTPLPALRVIKSAGEPLPPELAARCLAALDVELYNAYGPTETAVNVTAARVRPGEERVTIGTPAANVRCHVLDRALMPQPVGVPGELHVGGVQVAHGYLGRPKLTAARFVPDPFGPPGTRLYRTGDLVCRLPDGRLEFLGRADRQVKIRGMRVEPGEVESVLAGHPDVSQAVVTVRDDRPGGAVLAAYVLPGAERRPDPGALREWAAHRLPGHMTPATVIVMEAFPQLASGKVDRRRLPAPDAVRTDPAAAQPPAGDIERALADVFRRVLQLPEIGRHDGFFDLGGHSLLAVQALSAIRETTAPQTPLRLLFEEPTVAGLAAALSARGLLASAHDSGGTAPVRVPPRPDGAADVSAAERRVWLADRLDPGDPSYNMPLVCRLGGPVDHAALGAALRALPDRHEALRTSFPTVDGAPARSVAARAVLPVREEDLRGRDEEERRETLHRLLAAAAARRFDLGDGLPAHALVVRTAEEETVLALTVHHIVADGWSVRLLLEDLRDAYRTACAGGDPRVCPPRLGAGDYASSERSLLTDEVRAAGLAHWREKLAGAPAGQDLPADPPSPAADSAEAAGAGHHVVLPDDLAARLRHLAETEHCTPFMALLAGYAAVLARHCDTDEVLLSTPVADRGSPDLDGIVGLLLNTVVLRIPATPHLTFRVLLHEVRTAVLDAWEHRLLPFDDVVRTLGLDGRRLLRHSVTMDPVAVGTLPFADGVTLEPDDSAIDFSKAELNLYLEEHDGGGLAAWFVHRTADHSRERVHRMAGHFVAFLAAAAAGPDTPLGRLRMLTDAERAALVRGTTEPPRTTGTGTTLHRLFLEQAARTPEAVAVEDDAQQLTYARLRARACRLARRLTAHGAGPGTLVALALGRGVRQPEALLAVLLAGAAYVALDPHHPPARLRRVLADSGATVLVTTGDTAGAFAGTDVRLLGIEEPDPDTAEPDVPDQAAVPRTAEATGPGDLAYLAYTSGSTGEPKGVRVPHGAAAAYLADYLGARFDLGPQDTVLQLATLSFDASVRDLLGPLTTGARVLLLDDHLAADPDAVVAAVDRHGVTCLLSVVPTVLRAVLQAAEDGAPHGAGLRLVLTAGESLDLADAARAAAVFTGRPRTVNQYGPTECTMTTTAAPLTVEPGDCGLAPLGLPVAGAALWIVGRHGDLAPVGVPGEVWIGGSRVADGYHGRPAMTARCFVPEPFSGVPGARAYRTGDLARWEEDGTLTFLGRADDQVKIRGQRVEPGGVAGVLRGAPGVADAVVLAEPAAAGGELRLRAFVIPATLDGEALRTHLATLLPGHQVPALVQPLSTLPRTATGKVDRRALAALAEPEGRPEEPRTDTERAVADVFAEVLGADCTGTGPLGRDADFFARGGHSLLAARLAGRLERVAGRPVPLRLVFDLRTVAALAAWSDKPAPLDDAPEENGSPERRQPAAVPQEAGPYPLTPAQQAAWRHCRAEPDTAAYNIGFHARIDGPLDELALLRALDALQERHPVLRTRFPDAGDEPEARTDPAALLPVLRRDLSAEPDPQDAAERLATEALRAPFDLAAGPPARACVLRCAEDTHIVGLTVHHIAADGWTLSVLEDDLAVLYNAFAAGRRPAPRVVEGFARHAAAVAARAATPSAAADRAYWAERLRGIPAVLELPTDRPRTDRHGLEGGLELFDVPPDVADGVRRLAEETGGTTFMVLLAALQRWLAGLTGAERFLVAVPFAHRGPDDEQVAGPFADILPVPADLRGDPPFRELVARVRGTFLEVWEHRGVPFDVLARKYGTDPSRPPLCQVMFAVQNVPAAAHGLDGLALTPLSLRRGTCRYELHLRCEEDADGLSGWLEYSTALFEEQAVRRRLDGFLAALSTAVRSPDAPAGGC